MDNDLMFLNKCTPDELGVLVDMMKSKLSCELLDNACIYPTNHVSEIADEFCKFGGNTIANILRGGKGVPYREILMDVCRDLKVPFNEKQTIEHIENNLLETVLESSWDCMSDEDKKQFLKTMEYQGAEIDNGIWGILNLLAIKGVFSVEYLMSSIIANATARQVSGKDIESFKGAWAKISTTIKWLGAIIYWWPMINIMSAAKKVTVPGCVYIAALRKMKMNLVAKKL